MGDSQAVSKQTSPESQTPSSGNRDRASLLPRVPVEDAWLVNLAGDEVACLTTTELVDALRTGKVNDHTFVWREGFNDWLRIVQIPGLKRLAQGGVPRSNPGLSTLNTPRLAPDDEDFDAPTSVTMVGADALRLLQHKQRERAEARARNAESKAAGALAVYAKPIPTLAVAESVKAAWQASEDEGPASDTEFERAPLVAGTVPYGQYIGFEATLPAAVMPPITPSPIVAVADEVPASQNSVPASVRPQASDEPAPVQSMMRDSFITRESMDAVAALHVEKARGSFVRTTVGACIASAMLASAITIFVVRSSNDAGSHAPVAQKPVVKAAPVQSKPPAPTAKPAPAPEPAVTATANSEGAPSDAKPTKPKAKRVRPRVVRPVVASLTPPSVAPTATASATTLEPGSDLTASAAAPAATVAAPTNAATPSATPPPAPVSTTATPEVQPKAAAQTPATGATPSENSTLSAPRLTEPATKMPL